MHKFFIGVDISKLTLDVAVLHKGKVIRSFKVNNSEKDIIELLFTLKATFNITRNNSIFCAEDMGLYAKFLTNVLIKKKCSIWLESPLRIKLSMGIRRGKSDRIDACRIAEYAYRFQNQLTIWQPPRQIIQELKTLSTLRKNLVGIAKALKTRNKGNEHFLTRKENNLLKNYYCNTLLAATADIKRVERRIKELIKNDEKLNSLTKIITSIPQIGYVIAVEIITATNEFKDINCPKKFASYAGIAPFEYSSGTSLKGPARVSHIANKEIKTLLHVASMGYARSARKESQLGKYYLRKVAEGKNKMSVLNAVRNKLVHRIFSCVKRGEFFKNE
jgi:transposase